MALSRQVIISDGVTKQYPISFSDGYLSRNEVSVYEEFNDGTPSDPIAFTWVNNALIELERVPVIGSKIIIERNVDAAYRKVNFIPEYIKSSDLNTMYKHLLYLCQAVVDGRFEAALVKDLNMGFNRIYNLGAPVQDNDAVRLVDVKSYTDLANDILAQVIESRDKAKVSEDNAKESEINAKASEDIIVSKVDGFDARVEDATNDFNRNYNDKLVAFNINANDKTNDFDTNAATLTARYDNNDLAKTNAFNENAQNMTDGFNANALLKIDDFDAHAMTKEMEFDDHAAIKQGEVDASAAAAKNSENASSISEDNARESERKARIWAEGTDPEVVAIGGEHSSEGWADISKYWAGQSASGSVQSDWNEVDINAKSYIKNKPDVMTVDTDQEVDSSKTFMKDQAIKSPDLDIRTDRSKRGNGLIFTDKNGTQTAGIGVYINNNQSPECRLVASNGTQSAFAGLGVTTDGQGFFEVPTPKDGSNNRDAVNSEWVHRELTTHYVDKKGDTMTGALKFGTSGYIEANKANSTKGLALFGSIDGYGQGASIALRDNTADGTQAGVFKLETGNNITGHTHTLQGNPDGGIQWDSKELVRTINGATADKDGNIVISQTPRAYEQQRELPNLTGTVNIQPLDTDSIITMGAADNITLVWDWSKLTYPEWWYTLTLFIYFPNGAKTINMGGLNYWINGVVPNFSDGKQHLITIRRAKDGWLAACDAGVIG